MDTHLPLDKTRVCAATSILVPSVVVVTVSGCHDSRVAGKLGVAPPAPEPITSASEVIMTLINTTTHLGSTPPEDESSHWGSPLSR